MEEEPRTARRRRVLVAAGAAPTALTVLLWAVTWAGARFGVADAVALLALYLVVSLETATGASLLAAHRVRRAPAERLDDLAPVVWCTVAAAFAIGLLAMVAAFVLPSVVLGLSFLGVGVQVVAWVVGTGIARRRGATCGEPVEETEEPVGAEAGRRRRTLAAVGALPAALIAAAFVVLGALLAVDGRRADAAIAVLLVAPVAVVVLAGVPLLAARRAWRTFVDDLPRVAPLVWCTVLVTIAGLSLVVLAATVGDLRPMGGTLALSLLLLLQGLAWLLGRGLGSLRVLRSAAHTAEDARLATRPDAPS